MAYEPDAQGLDLHNMGSGCVLRVYAGEAHLFFIHIAVAASYHRHVALCRQ